MAPGVDFVASGGAHWIGAAHGNLGQIGRHLYIAHPVQPLASGIAGVTLGGEPSGHVIFSKLSTAGDGMIAALQVLAAVVKSKKKLSQLVSEIPLYPQVNCNIKVKSQKPIDDIPEMAGAIKLLEQRLKNKGRAVVRYSGTEPVLRLMIEGENQQIIQAELENLTKIAEAYLS